MKNMTRDFDMDYCGSQTALSSQPRGDILAWARTLNNDALLAIFVAKALTENRIPLKIARLVRVALRRGLFEGVLGHWVVVDECY